MWIFVTLYCAMRVRLVPWAVVIFAAIPGSLWAVEAAPTIFDREIVERLTRIETRFDGIDTRLDGLETRLEGLETRLDGLETRIGTLETRLDEGLASLRADRARQSQQLHTRLSDFLWIFIGVMGFFGVIIAALLTLVVRDRKAPVHLAERDAESLRDIRQQMDTIRDILRDFGEINAEFAAILKRRPTL